MLAAWWRIGLGAILAANSMALSLAINTSEASAGERLGVHVALLVGSAAVLVLLGGPLVRAAWQEARRARPTIEALFLAGIFGALGASLAAMAAGEGAVYFETASLLLVVYAFGRQIGNLSRNRALESARALAPGTATCEALRDDGTTEAIPVSDLRPGRRVLVRPGETLPADGVVEEGEAFVRESELTGEPFAVFRRPGDAVHAGTHCMDGLLRVRATAGGGDRRIDRIVAAIEAARAEPTRLERQADRIVRWFLPLVLAVAAGTFVAWTLLDGFAAGLYDAMAVLLVACPCAMGFATPVAIWSALTRLAGHGLVVRNGEAVERIALADTAVLDKTGTLTLPQPVLADLVVDGGGAVPAEDVPRILASVERAVLHPLAEPFAGLDAGAAPLETAALRLLPGAGVEAEVREPRGGPARIVRVGDPERLAGDPGIAEEWERLAARLSPGPGRRRIVLIVDGRAVAAAAVDEKVRDAAGEAIAALEALGLRPILMTGDREARGLAGAVADVRAGLSPEEKERAVRALRDEGRRVLFVGDGVNDAAAMASSDVGIAVASGAPLAVEVADVSWSGADPRAIPLAVRVCREAVGTIRSNLRLAAAYNLAGMSVAAAGLLHPVVAVLLMACSSLVVNWRALRILDDAPAGGAP